MTKKKRKGTGRKKSRAKRSVPRAIRILATQRLSAELKRLIFKAAPAKGFDRAVTLEGSTQHFQVYFQTGFANGPAIARGVLATCERNYNTLVGFFSGLVPPTLPMNLIVAPGIGGAYHYGCSATDLYCDGDTSANPNVDHTPFLVIAEETEVFEAAQNKGWDCGASNGEGLSRVLATELYPAELNGFYTAASWLDSNRSDWVNQTDSTDQNAVSTGCAVLFLNYLRYELKYSWQQIIQAAGSMLEQTYKSLTGSSGGFVPFKKLLDGRFPPGQPSGLTTDNPFPFA